MRPASEVERRRLNDLFAELCAIPSVSGREGAMGARVRGELEALGFAVSEDDAAATLGTECGNLTARIPGRTERSTAARIASRTASASTSTGRFTAATTGSSTSGTESS